MRTPTVGDRLRIGVRNGGGQTQKDPYGKSRLRVDPRGSMGKSRVRLPTTHSTQGEKETGKQATVWGRWVIAHKSSLRSGRGNGVMQRAFTLIELLIVVAIIAILAAIAVPNFLEAQTRAKVSRAHSGMRTLATAFEAYTLDWNRAPLDYLEWENLYGVPQWQRYYCYRQLTTPVAYITSWLNDPFAKSPRLISDRLLALQHYPT